MTSPSPSILVVDDKAAIREVLEIRLTEWGFRVLLAGSGEEAKELAETRDPDLVISDVVLPELSGLELLRALKAGRPQRPVLMMTAYGSVDAAVEAMKVGAENFLTKPLDYPKLRTMLDELVQRQALRSDAARLDARLAEGAGLGELVGTSKPMRKVYKLLRTLATIDAAAIVVGESGTGKELAARTLHQLSNRRDGPFVAVNSAAIPEGLIESEIFGHERGAFTGAVGTRQGCFEMADRGTLFLDEIGEMPAALQPKLLRILESRRVRRLGGSREIAFNVRILAATNRDPERAVEDGLLRRDLFYRLNVFTVTMPPLREREGDLPLLTRHFVHRFNRKHGTRVEGVGEDAIELLQGYGWPGNVRELRNVMERGVVLAAKGWIEPSHLPVYVRRPTGTGPEIVLPAGVTAAEAEKILILETLERTGNNKTETARRLGLDAKTIRNKLRVYSTSAASRP